MSWVHELYNIPTWKKYSQANEESYLDFILARVPSKTKLIVEFGAWDGVHLSNTKYFIDTKGYEALLIDGDNHGNINVKEHFITKENVIDILEKYKVPVDFDLFCIDLDGNDIYIMEEVLNYFKPRVIIAEYNPKFQPNESYAIKYDPEHTWSNDDYYGFSFLAGQIMAKKFGYTCIFQNDALNMYFVKNEYLAESLGCEVSEIDSKIPQATYRPTHYHPVSNKNNWVVYQ